MSEIWTADERRIALIAEPENRNTINRWFAVDWLAEYLELDVARWTRIYTHGDSAATYFVFTSQQFSLHTASALHPAVEDGLAGVILLAHPAEQVTCPGREPPVLAVTRPARPHKSAVQK
jgi:hypothetical protein